MSGLPGILMVVCLLQLHPAGSYSATEQEADVRFLTDGTSASRAPAWSPDGGRIAFESNRAGSWGLYLLHLKTGIVEQLTHGDGDDRYPAWSPDSDRIVFVSDRGGAKDLYVLDLRDREVALLSENPGDEYFPAWSPDGREIAFTRQLGDSIVIRSLVMVEGGGTSSHVNSVGAGKWPRWRQDGKRLAFFSRRDTDDQDDEIYLLDVEIGDVRRLTNRAGHWHRERLSPRDRTVLVTGWKVDRVCGGTHRRSGVSIGAREYQAGYRRGKQMIEERGGWFVKNVKDAAWLKSDAFGMVCGFDVENPFPQVGIHIFILEPGKPNCRYHREEAQEDFLVLAGSCKLLINGEERSLKAWDFVHCPAGATHVFVGEADGPCALLAIGHRETNKQIFYPASDLARSHGAESPEPTDEPRVAYSDVKPREKTDPPKWPVV